MMSSNDQGKLDTFAMPGAAAGSFGMPDDVEVAESARIMLLGDATMSSLATANIEGRRVLKLLVGPEPIVSPSVEDAKAWDEEAAGALRKYAEEKTPAAAPTCNTIFSTQRDVPRMRKIIAEYVEGLGREVGKLLEFMNQRDLQPLRRVAHQLRGSGGGYGFDAISELAGRVEDAIAAGDNIAGIRMRVLCLVEAIGRVDGYEDCSG